MNNSPARPIFVTALVCTIVMALVSQPASAQSYLTQAGSPTFTTALPVELGFINVANGNLHLEIPLGSWPERSAVKSLDARWVYDSRIWRVIYGVDGLQWYPDNVQLPTYLPTQEGGWRLLTSADVGTRGAPWTTTYCYDNFGHPYGTYATYSPFSWTDPGGATHVFPIATVHSFATGCGSNYPTGSALAADSSGFRMDVSNFTDAIVYAPDGTQVYPSVQDANGNSFTRNANNDVVDTLGRTPITTIQNCNGNSNQTCYDVLNSQNTSSRYTVTTTTVLANTVFNQPGIPERSNYPVTVIDTIALPDGSSYHFGYDSHAELATVQLPTGGSVSYSYGNFPDAYSNTNRWVNQRVSGGGTWTYSGPNVTDPSLCQSGSEGCQQVTVTKPSGDTMVYTFSLNGGAWNSKAQYNDASLGTLATINISYDLTQTCSGCTGAGYVRALTNTTTLNSIGGALLTKQTQYSYDNPTFGNITDIKEWNFYTGSPSQTPDRETATTYSSSDANYVTKNILNRPIDVVSYLSGAKVAETKYVLDTPANLTSITGIEHHDDTNFGIGNTVRGNVTQVQQWAGGANFLNTATLTYDTTGQLIQSQDAKLNPATTYDYTDSFYTDNGNNLSPASTTAPGSPTNAYVTKITPPLIGFQTLGYYLGTGQLATTKDQNNAISYFHFYDSLSRPTQTHDAEGGWTFFTYTAQTQTDTYTSLNDTTASSSCTSCRHDRTVLDNLGRLQQSILVSDPDGQVKVDTTYDANGRVSSISNPYRSASPPDSTYGLTGMNYDGLDRLIKTIRPDNGQNNNNVATTAYGPGLTSASPSCGNALAYPSVSTDEVGKKRQFWTDGLGRLIEVDEPNSSGSFAYATCYQYTAADGSTQLKVTQRGGLAGPDDPNWRIRTFNHDSLGRLTSVVMPESGTTSYTYPVSGAMCAGDLSLPCTRTDARSVTTTYTYDALNRLTGKSYTATTPATPSVFYFYDQPSYNGLTITNGKGRRTGMSDGSGLTAWTYSPMGRVLTKRQTIAPASSGLASMSGDTTYTYNLDGSVATITYPSTPPTPLRTVRYSYNNALQATSLVDNATSIYRNFVTNAHYNAPGGLTSATHGDGINETNNFNKRVQPLLLSTASRTQTLLSYGYSYDQGSGSNNGSVVQMINNLTGTRNPSNNRSVAFTYDQLNRLQTAGTVAGAGTPWTTTYTYDPWGNLTQKATTGPGEPIIGPFTMTNQNRINGYTYDAAGNLTFDGHNNLNFDGENQVHPLTGLQYYYDGDGHRVAKSDGSRYWYDDAFNVLYSADSTNNIKRHFIFFNGDRIAYVSVSSGDPHYYLTDHLGSPHVIANGDGTVVSWESDYWPYGGDIPISNVDGLSRLYLFTGYAFDSETSDLYADFREQSPALGRFFSPDPANTSMDFSNPQSLNRYSYVMNNPTNLTDSLGLDPLCDILCPPSFPVPPIPIPVPIPPPNLPGGGNSNVGVQPPMAGENLGLPVWLPMAPPSLTDFFPELPKQCDFGPCVRGNAFGPGVVLAGGGTIICQIAEPCGVIEDALILGGLIIEGAIAIHMFGKVQSNEWSDAAVKAAPQDPCGWLKEQRLKPENQDSATKQKITQAEKFLGCRNVRKRR